MTALHRRHDMSERYRNYWSRIYRDVLAVGAAWEKRLDILMDDSDYKWLMIDASHCKVHTHAAGAKGWLTKIHLLADRGGDSNAIIKQAVAQGMSAVILPRQNPTGQRPCDADLYKLRHLVENAFLHLKRWRGIAT